MFRPKKIPKAKSSIAKPISPDHQRLVTLINSMGDAVLSVNPEGIVLLSNGAALSLFDNNNLTSKNISEFMDLIDQKGNKFNTSSILNQRSSFFNRDLRLKYSDGSIINLEINVSPVRLTFGLRGGGFVILARDITKRKSVEEERDEFISVASHELRTPIAITEGNIGNALVLAEKSDSNPAIIESLSAAHEQIIFLGYLVNDLSMLSRAEGKNSEIEIKQINVDRMLADLIDDYRDRAIEKKLQLTLTVNLAQPNFDGNELYVREILQNFITNAIKYTKQGEVEVSASNSKNGIIFSVKDTGYGIDASEHEKLFSKFFRSQDNRVQQSNGTGLGLYVCAKLAKLMNGKIEVESALNKGSVFRLLLPDVQNAKMG